MNKTALKKFAASARTELLNQIALRAGMFGVTATETGKMTAATDHVVINNVEYPQEYKRAYETLVKQWKQQGFGQLLEEVAYTWFNRFIALRFMEVNGYLPAKIRILSSENPGQVDPDILLCYQESGLPVDVDRVRTAQQAGDREQAFRLLLIAQCNELHEIMPFLFEKINDYTELLLPGSLLHADSVINRLVREVPEEDFTQVEIIGWLYQYYISEKKNRIVGMNKGAVAKEDLPAATQLFTPQWIVQYMVQNSLGKLWYEMYPESGLIGEWEYFLKPRTETEYRREVMPLESIKIIDPACGSGHILIYAFDVLYKLYESQGYPVRDIPYLIVENNLYGLDIDKRAAQLAGFALMMKVRSCSRRLKPVQLHVHEFIDGEQISDAALGLFCKDDGEKGQIKTLVSAFENAKCFGSLIIPPEIDYDWFLQRFEELKPEHVGLIEQAYIYELREKLLPVLMQAQMLAQKYIVVVTNPPYHNKYNPALKGFILKQYADYKTDLYSAFIYRCANMTKKNGYYGMMTPFTWMFLTTHEKLRKYINENQNISSLVQLEYSAFKEATVPICTFVIHNWRQISLGEYVRLCNFKGEDTQSEKLKEAIMNPFVGYRYEFDGRNYKNIPGSPIAYWIDLRIHELYKNSKLFLEYTISDGQNKTGNNEEYLRMFWEVENGAIGIGNKWLFYAKGGGYRKWAGNLHEVINWSEEAREHYKKDRVARILPEYLWYKKGITWGAVTSSLPSFRILPENATFDIKGSSLFLKNENTYMFFLAFLNSCVSSYILDLLNPTISLQVRDVRCLPIKLATGSLIDQIKTYTVTNISISQQDWDCNETSWGFKQHPIIIFKKNISRIAEAYINWEGYAERQFNKLQKNEEQLNKIFIELYELFDVLVPDIPNNQVTVCLANRERDTKSFLSYAIGCMMGRYSLDTPGLAYAGGEFDWSKYQTFLPDQDGILPFTEQTYFEDDIISRLEEFLKVTFGAETLRENMAWLAESLTMKPNETPAERLRRYFFDEFYQDHLRIYQKRPIYWLFDSGKKKGFRALVYLHRYTPETLAALRLNYLHELQVKYNGEERRLEQLLDAPGTSKAAKAEAAKQLQALRLKQEELVAYDKVLTDYANRRIAFDMDDGVAANYTKLEALLAKIK